MTGICALTKKESQLKQSHIFPKFVLEWMKNTGSNYLWGNEQNKRQQDGPKPYLLSDEAEQMFSRREKWFAENIFHPYLKDPTISFSYDKNLFYFAISMLWRILVYRILEQPNIEEFKQVLILREAEEQWRMFLYKEIYPKNFDRIHLLTLTMRHISENFQKNLLQTSGQ